MGGTLCFTEFLALILILYYMLMSTIFEKQISFPKLWAMVLKVKCKNFTVI